jgi:hypothetical protein
MAAGAPVVPAAALPSWPQPTNPTAPGSRSATARPDNPGPPAYTLPAVPSTNSPPAAAPASFAGAAGPASAAQPNSAPVAASPEYHQWARNQRPAGTTYSGLGAGQMTTMMGGGSPLESSGSLTGHILAQGYADRPTPKSRTAKVLVIGLVLLGVLVVAGLLAATVASDAVKDLFDSFMRS